MLARNETIFKWLLYALAAASCLLVQGAVLQRITLWGVIPFVYPMVAVIPATYEDTLFGTVFALCVGIICDLILPDMFPCLYTLIFPLAALCASAFSRSLMRAGFLCSLLSSAVAFILLDSFRCLLLWFNRKSAWAAGFSVMAREFLISALLVIPVTLLFRAVSRRAHIND